MPISSRRLAGTMACLACLGCRAPGSESPGPPSARTVEATRTRAVEPPPLAEDGLYTVDLEDAAAVVRPLGEGALLIAAQPLSEKPMRIAGVEYPAHPTKTLFVRLSKEGGVQWARHHDLRLPDHVTASPDGGAVTTSKLDGCPGPAPACIEVARLDAQGERVFAKAFDEIAILNSVAAAVHGRDTIAFGAEFSGPWPEIGFESQRRHGAIVVLDAATGTIRATETYDWLPTALVPTTDDAFIVAGDIIRDTELNGHRLSNPRNPQRHWVTATNGMVAHHRLGGETTWAHSIGDEETQRVAHARPAPDGGWIIGGRTGHGELVGLPKPEAVPAAEVFVAKLDDTGVPVWSTLLGGLGQERLQRLYVDGLGRTWGVATTNLPYAFVRHSGFPDAPLIGDGDYVVLFRLDSNGRPDRARVLRRASLRMLDDERFVEIKGMGEGMRVSVVNADDFISLPHAAPGPCAAELLAFIECVEPHRFENAWSVPCFAEGEAYGRCEDETEP